MNNLKEDINNNIDDLCNYLYEYLEIYNYKDLKEMLEAIYDMKMA